MQVQRTKGFALSPVLAVILMWHIVLKGSWDRVYER
jgi:hypothetical protein